MPKTLITSLLSFEAKFTKFNLLFCSSSPISLVKVAPFSTIKIPVESPDTAPALSVIILASIVTLSSIVKVAL
ncbi:MAG: hypothetical protein HRU35_01275 [Rickettsiaceae bacterium]|nr:hypothetical protein [Rickettsiaceae bacterium]